MITTTLSIEKNAFDTRAITRIHGLNSRVPEWDRVSRRFTPSGAKKVKNAAKYIEGVIDIAPHQSKYYPSRSYKKGWSVFITLTFRKRNIDHKEAKAKLNSWLTMQRKKTQFLYVWTAERQKDGTIHFHIVANRPVPKASLQSWQRLNGRIDAQYVKKSASGYISKYISKTNGIKEDYDFIIGKRYGISQEIYRLFKYQKTAIYNYPPEFIDQINIFFQEYDPEFYYGVTNVKALKPDEIDFFLDDFVDCFGASSIFALSFNN